MTNAEWFAAFNAKQMERIKRRTDYIVNFSVQRRRNMLREVYAVLDTETRLAQIAGVNAMGKRKPDMDGRRGQ